MAREPNEEEEEVGGGGGGGQSGFRGPDLRFGFGSMGFVFMDALLRGTQRDVVKVGDVIIAGNDVPSYRIVQV